MPSTGDHMCWELGLLFRPENYRYFFAARRYPFVLDALKGNDFSLRRPLTFGAALLFSISLINLMMMLVFRRSGSRNVKQLDCFLRSEPATETNSVTRAHQMLNVVRSGKDSPLSEWSLRQSPRRSRKRHTGLSAARSSSVVRNTFRGGFPRNSLKQKRSAIIIFVEVT